MTFQIGNKQSDDGLALIDVLAASLVVGMTLAIVLQLLISALSNALSTRMRELALIVGASVAAEYEAGAIRSTTGQHPEHGQPILHWQVENHPEQQDQWRLRVSWKERRRNAELTIASTLGNGMRR